MWGTKWDWTHAGFLPLWWKVNLYPSIYGADVHNGNQIKHLKLRVMKFLVSKPVATGFVALLSLKV